MQYICTQLSGNDCVSWVESQGLTLSDVQLLLPVVVSVLAVAFGLRLIRRFLLR